MRCLWPDQSGWFVSEPRARSIPESSQLFMSQLILGLWSALKGFSFWKACPLSLIKLFSKAVPSFMHWIWSVSPVDGQMRVKRRTGRKHDFIMIYDMVVETLWSDLPTHQEAGIVTLLQRHWYDNTTLPITWWGDPQLTHQKFDPTPDDLALNTSRPCISEELVDVGHDNHLTKHSPYATTIVFEMPLLLTLFALRSWGNPCATSGEYSLRRQKLALQSRD